MKTLADALELVKALGYDRSARPVDVKVLNLPSLTRAYVIRTPGTRRTGYGVLVGQAPELPRSLRPLARAVQREIHDFPLAVVGVGNGGSWERLVVFRPRRTGGQLGAVTVARLDVDLTHPTGHDAEVISALRWRADLPASDAQAAVSSALDVEAVTNRFYRGLRPHFDALEAAVSAVAARNVARGEAIEVAGGVRRVAIRILTQLLFCYFLQRKHLLAGDRDYLSRAYSQHSGLFYPTVLEPLFYEVLAVPVDERLLSAATASIPFLNGGLFERRYSEVSLDLPDQVFSLDQGILGYLDHWTFTVAEETADETEVAVDPEMLGRIFESLLPDVEREQKGTYYTPRPVVQFMCREALVARLVSVGFDEGVLRTLVSEDDPLAILSGKMSHRDLAALARALESRLSELTVIDPAVGSGAFLLGMLGEMVRLRGIAHVALHGFSAPDEQIHAWKLHAIERTLFGVDIEPTAVELCRLRLWLSLAVELAAGRPVPPLPNLEYRTVCADSLVDFVEGIPIQDTGREVASSTKGAREAKGDSMFGALVVDEVVSLRAQYFSAALPTDKAKLRGQLLDAENTLLDSWLAEAHGQLRRNPAAQSRLDSLRGQLRSPERIYPVFMPGFSAPDVWRDGGWDIVIMNPPYVGRKEIPQRYPAEVVRALELHYGQTRDLMVLFGERALQLARPDGVMSMIFNDSIFTSSDADEFRRALFDRAAVTVVARTKCFEGQAVNGGVIVARRALKNETVRWVEGYKRPVADFAAASAALEDGATLASAGEMEVFVRSRDVYTVLPHRPLYRPSDTATGVLDRYREAVDWSTLSAWGPSGWDLVSNSHALELAIEERRRAGMYSRLQPGNWVLLGLVSDGGQGLATADDRRFIAAIEGTPAADEHHETQRRLEETTLRSSFASEYRSLLRTHGTREAALLALWAVHGAKRPSPLKWPKGATFRIAQQSQLNTRVLSEEERKTGISSQKFWVPFEKGDQSQTVESVDGRAGRVGAKWIRDNALVIEWSIDAVSLLRRRAASVGAQRPYFRNEHLWFEPGVTWNAIASYLRARLMPAGSIFGHGAPVIRPFDWIEWLSPLSLLALLNADVVEYVLRTFLASRMNLHVGDIRHLVIPVLSQGQKQDLEALSRRAITAKQAAEVGQPGERLTEAEAEIHRYVRDLYGLPESADLWQVR